MIPNELKDGKRIRGYAVPIYDWLDMVRNKWFVDKSGLFSKLPVESEGEEPARHEQSFAHEEVDTRKSRIEIQRLITSQEVTSINVKEVTDKKECLPLVDLVCMLWLKFRQLHVLVYHLAA